MKQMIKIITYGHFFSMWFYPLFINLLYILSVVGYDVDEVVTLPGLNDSIKFKHYSGYLDAGKHKLHYWFVESENDPQNAPVILWMNGGPGCSSLDGLLSELGPFHIKDHGNTVYLNQYSWNKIANVIFLEAPAGVGFSYSEDKNYMFDDDKVSHDNYEAMKDFFKKYPQFADNPLYITGESYGGIYVPTLTVRIIKEMPDNGMNLQGFAIGNGLLSVSLNDQTILYFAYFHGVIGQSQWNDILSYCCTTAEKPKNLMSSMKIDYDSCNFTAPPNQQCYDGLKEAWRMIFYSGINDYSLYRPCDPVSSNSQFVSSNNLNFENLTTQSMDRLVRYHNAFKAIFTHSPSLSPQILNEITREVSDTLNLKYQRSDTPLIGNSVHFNPDPVFTTFHNNQNAHQTEKYTESVPCIDSSALINYLNKPEVKKALHISDKSAKWDVCSQMVGETYKRVYDDMFSQFAYILNYHKNNSSENASKKAIRGLVYNGDTDLMCNFLGAQLFIAQLNLTQQGTHKTWMNGPQVAGFVDYHDNLVFATVKGAGHMVPQWKPEESFLMITHFLKNEPL